MRRARFDHHISECGCEVGDTVGQPRPGSRLVGGPFPRRAGSPRCRTHRAGRSASGRGRHLVRPLDEGVLQHLLTAKALRELGGMRPGQNLCPVEHKDGWFRNVLAEQLYLCFDLARRKQPHVLHRVQHYSRRLVYPGRGSSEGVGVEGQVIGQDIADRAVQKATFDDSAPRPQPVCLYPIIGARSKGKTRRIRPSGRRQG